jgi:hypothetical protein
MLMDIGLNIEFMLDCAHDLDDFLCDWDLVGVDLDQFFADW